MAIRRRFSILYSSLDRPVAIPDIAGLTLEEIKSLHISPAMVGELLAAEKEGKSRKSVMAYLRSLQEQEE